MSGTFPTTPEIEHLKITSWQPTLVSVAHSLARQARSRGGAQRWAIEATYPSNLSRAELAPVFAFALKQRGQYSIFTFTPPALWGTARGAAGGTPQVNLAGQTGRTVNTKGWTHGVTGILRAGDFLKFNGHAKVYLVTADANSDSNGQAALNIEPALMAAPADNEAIVVANVPFSVAFAGDVQEFDVSWPNKHAYKMSFVEVF